MTGNFIRSGEENREAQERRQCKNGNRNWIYFTTSQGTPRNASNHQALVQKHGRIFPHSFYKELALLIPWFWTSSSQNCERIYFSYFKPPSVTCYGNIKQFKSMKNHVYH
jgi:hypothetical protein